MSDRSPITSPRPQEQFERTVTVCLQEQSHDIADLASICMEFSRKLQALEEKVAQLQAAVRRQDAE